MENKKKKFKLFDLTREGKGISKNAKELDPGFKRFFLSFWNNFGKLVSVNIFMVLGNFPILFLIANLAGAFKTGYSQPLSDLLQNVYGIFAAKNEPGAYELAILGIEGVQSPALANTVWNYIFYGISALTLVTFGCVNAGCAYILRNIARGEPIFLWTDFFYAVKRNWKQALPFGAIDLAINAILVLNLYTLVTGTAEFLTSVLFWSTVVVYILYFTMRYYIYIQMVTFKLSVFKILKNSFSFALLGFKRNTAAFFGILILLVLELMFLLGTNGILVPLAVAMPLAIFFAACAYMKVYAAYFKIKEIMIDPYYAEHPEERPEPEADQEAIMRDDVTERERLAEIKRRNHIEDEE